MNLKCKKRGWELAVTKAFDELLLIALRNGIIEKVGKREVTRNKKNIKLLNKITEYIEQHFSEEISLEELADYCNYSKCHFSRVIREVTNMNFSSLLTAFRVERAKGMLLAGETITETAYFCGFTNIRSFYRGFKEYTGFSPKEFLEKIENMNNS